jgi:hypothetical protein
MEAHRVYEKVPLPPGHLLRGVVTSRTSLLCRLDGLTVHDRSARLRFSPGFYADHLTQLVVDSRPRPVVGPQPEVPGDRAPRREIMWKVAPLTARSQNVQDCIDDLAHAHSAVPPSVLLRWNHRLDYVPLFISQVCGIPSARNHSKAS